MVLSLTASRETKQEENKIVSQVIRLGDARASPAPPNLQGRPPFIITFLRLIAVSESKNTLIKHKKRLCKILHKNAILTFTLHIHTPLLIPSLFGPY